jgi:hypothetical protein
MLSKLLLLKKKPCSECPYKLGLVRTLVNPCPMCKLYNFKTYEKFLKWTLKK